MVQARWDVLRRQRTSRRIRCAIADTVGSAVAVFRDRAWPVNRFAPLQSLSRVPRIHGYKARWIEIKNLTTDMHDTQVVVLLDERVTVGVVHTVYHRRRAM